MSYKCFTSGQLDTSHYATPISVRCPEDHPREVCPQSYTENVILFFITYTSMYHLLKMSYWCILSIYIYICIYIYASMTAGTTTVLCWWTKETGTKNGSENQRRSIPLQASPVSASWPPARSIFNHQTSMNAQSTIKHGDLLCQNGHWTIKFRG
jgi:hypothetical protein